MGTMASQITSLTIVYSIVYFRHRLKKTSKLRVTGLCVGNSPVIFIIIKLVHVLSIDVNGPGTMIQYWYFGIETAHKVSSLSNYSKTSSHDSRTSTTSPHDKHHYICDLKDAWITFNFPFDYWSFPYIKQNWNSVRLCVFPFVGVSGINWYFVCMTKELKSTIYYK